MNKKLALFLAAFALLSSTARSDEKKFSLYTSGEIYGSARNYSGDRFDDDYSGKSYVGRVPGIYLEAGYQFTPKWSAKVASEFISGYGVQLDEFSGSYKFNDALNLKAGIFGLPVGHCNSRYDYTDYFTTGDPEGEFAMIPCPFTELGLALSGELPCGFSYEFDFTTGIDADYANHGKWMKECCQGFKFDNFNFASPAFALRLNYEHPKGFFFGAGVYHTANSARNMTDYKDFKQFHGKKVSLPTTIWYAEGEYKHDWFTVRASYMQGALGHAKELSDYFMSTDGENVARGVIDVMGEVNFNLKNIFYKGKKGPEFYPFFHYEYYDSQYKAPVGLERDSRGKVNLWSAGVNYKPIEQVAIKLNYTHRKIGGGSFANQNEVNLGVAWSVDIF